MKICTLTFAAFLFKYEEDLARSGLLKNNFVFQIWDQFIGVVEILCQYPTINYMNQNHFIHFIHAQDKICRSLRILVAYWLFYIHL